MSMPIRVLAVPAGFVALALAGTACDIKVGEKGLSVDIADGRASDEWTRTYTLPEGGRLEIVNTDGTIAAVPSAGPQVEVRVTREVRSRSDEAAREILKGLSMTEDVLPDRVRVEAEAPQARGFRQSVRIDYRVSVPAGLHVSLKTQNGGVRLDNIEGQLTASSTNGAITGRGLSGSLDASTVNGGITIELAAVTGDTRLVTVNGGIRLDLRPDVNATLEAGAVNGGVTVDDRLPLSADERARLRVSGRINKGGPRILVQTTNGGIRIGAGAAP